MASLRVLGLVLLPFILSLSGCKSISQLHCPDFASTKSHSPSLFAFHSIRHKSGRAAFHNVSIVKNSTSDSTLLLTSMNDMPFKIKMPGVLSQKLEDDKDIEEMNQYLASYKSSHFKLERDKTGMPYLKAHSYKDIPALTKKSNQPPNSYEKRFGPDPHDGSREAYISKVLGAFGVVSLLLIIPVFAFALGVSAIVVARKGMHSAKRQFAITGLRLGIISLVIALVVAIILAIVLVVVV